MALPCNYEIYKANNEKFARENATIKNKDRTWADLRMEKIFTYTYTCCWEDANNNEKFSYTGFFGRSFLILAKINRAESTPDLPRWE